MRKDLEQCEGRTRSVSTSVGQWRRTVVLLCAWSSGLPHVSAFRVHRFQSGRIQSKHARMAGDGALEAEVLGRDHVSHIRRGAEGRFSRAISSNLYRFETEFHNIRQKVKVHI